MGMGILGGEGQRVENWDNCNSIINKKYFFKKEVAKKVDLKSSLSQETNCNMW